MYCASSVYIYIAKMDPQAGLSRAETDNLEFVIQAMEAIGRHHLITQAFLQQICADVERNGLAGAIAVPGLAKYRNAFGWASSNVPLLARSYLTNHSEIQVPLPGRLPLGVTSGTYDPAKTPQAQRARGCAATGLPGEGVEATNKRRRTSPPPPQQQQQQQDGQSFDWDTPGASTTFYSTNPEKPRGVFGGGLLRASGVAPMSNGPPRPHPQVSVALPHRTSANASPVPRQMGGMAPLGIQPQQGDALPYTASAMPPTTATTVGYDAAGAFVYPQPGPQDMGGMAAMGFPAADGVDPWTFMPVMDDVAWAGMGRGDGTGAG